MASMKASLATLAEGLPLSPLPGPAQPVLNYVRDSSVPHAPVRVHGLTTEQKKVRHRRCLSSRGYQDLSEGLGSLKNGVEAKNFLFYFFGSFQSYSQSSS